MKMKMDAGNVERPLKSKIQKMMKGFPSIEWELSICIILRWVGALSKHAGYVWSFRYARPLFSESEKERVPKSPDQVLGDFGKMEEEFGMLTRTSVIVMTDLLSLNLMTSGNGCAYLRANQRRRPMRCGTAETDSENQRTCSSRWGNP